MDFKVSWYTVTSYQEICSFPDKSVLAFHAGTANVRSLMSPDGRKI